ncbi:hypothetical protein EI427_20515 [Flammeovirga pectinis]|uniref:Uncharacterized protein n=1 Tax=Flammeovirga pectinis TaxID=2494373 RepID=A0A3Q9FTV0_9BACT|nr:hypothetical protein [Flammeovirga pectinis]AZQ64501.1 hypothetical protein EI427_20515 [Flammeovirga pectinis]
MKKFSNKKRVAKMVGFGIIAISLITTVFMFLWNWLMPVIFGLTTISFFQSLGLLVMSKIIFSGANKPSFRQREKAMMRKEKFMHQMKKRKFEMKEEETDLTDSKE